MATATLINPCTDDLIAVTKIAQDRTGKRPCPSTIWRWVRKGCRGITLQAVQLGGRWMTTEAAWREFIEGQTAAALTPANHAAEERDAATERRLKAAGLL